MDRQPSKGMKRQREKESSSSSSSSSSSGGAFTQENGRRRMRNGARAGHDEETPRKRRRVEKPEPQDAPVEDLRVKVLKRNLRDYGEDPSSTKKKRRVLQQGQEDGEIPSTSSSTSTSSLHTGNDSSDGYSLAVGEGPSQRRRPKKKAKRSSREIRRAELWAKYTQQNQLGEGACGSVFAGFRRADMLPVAIKHIPKGHVFCKVASENGKKISAEVAIMAKLANQPAVEVSAPVALLDWYDLGRELILVMERPIPACDLWDYIRSNGGSLQEEEAKIIMKQLVDATKGLEDNCIFHRDIKVENILIETGSDTPRVRIIDFGLSCYAKKRSRYRIFYGTPDHIHPEYYSSKAYKAGPTTTWQLGVVLYESLNVAPAFETKDFLSKTLKISSALSEDCQDFLQRCLAIAPTQRPSLEELRLHPWLR